MERALSKAFIFQQRRIPLSPSVATFPKNTNFITHMRTGLLEAEDDNAISPKLAPNADNILPDRVHLMLWKDPYKTDALPFKDRPGEENVMCCSIELSGTLCSDTATNDVPPRSVMTSSGRNRQRSR